MGNLSEEQVRNGRRRDARAGALAQARVGQLWTHVLCVP